MKKLMIAALAVGFAACAQAAVFKWTTAGIVYGVDPSAVTGNGSYSAATSALGGNSALTYTLTLYTQGHGGDENYKVGSQSGAAKFGTTGKGATTNISIAEAGANTTYDYVFTLTGTQTDLAAKPDKTVGDTIYHYSGASIEYIASGEITAKSSAVNVPDVPSSWTVKGITTEAIPEPTSGLLLLLGVAGLALRRRRA